MKLLINIRVKTIVSMLPLYPDLHASTDGSTCIVIYVLIGNMACSKNLSSPKYYLYPFINSAIKNFVWLTTPLSTTQSHYI